MAPSLLERATTERQNNRDILEYIQGEIAQNPITPLDEYTVDHLLSMSKTSQFDVIEINKKIQSTSPSDMELHSEEFKKLLSLSTKVISQLTGFKIKFNLTCESSSLLSAISVPGYSDAGDIRLPRIELPTFDGDIYKWVSFRDMFVSTVHTNKRLSNSQKLTYLKAQLRDEAARQIQSLIITDANYHIAWNQLSDRYQNDRQLLFAVLNKFTSQATILSSSASALRHLIDVSRECMRSLEVLNQPVEYWDSILLFHIHQKMDPTSKELYEQGLHNSSIPNLKGLFEFLEQRSRSLEASKSCNGSARNTQQIKKEEKKQRPYQVHHAQSSNACYICKENHPIFKCSTFLSLNVNDRLEMAKKHRLCFNCLSMTHNMPQCTSKGVCRTCNKRHNSLLHKANQNLVQQPVNQQEGQFVLNHHLNVSNNVQTLLATANVLVADSTGQNQTIRILLDGGSDTHIITNKCVQKLGLRWKRTNVMVTGLSSISLGSARGETSVDISPYFNSSYTLHANNVLIMQSITGKLPMSPCSSNLLHLQGLNLADKSWFYPNEIDMLIGASLFFSILGGEKVIGRPGEPIAINSSLGWLVVGEVDTRASKNCDGRNPLSFATHVHQAKAVQVQELRLDSQLRQFWEIESVPSKRELTSEELACEKHFISTHKRNLEGRFVVQLPFKTNEPRIGSSREMAIQRLKHIERKLESQPLYKKEYCEFMSEYLELGHMEEIPPNEIHRSPSCYIPHHFIVKDSSTTTKFRVVFDASSKTSNGKSLNHSMMVGSTLQDNLIDILIRFRTHPIAFTADIAKMYRQVLVTPKDSDFQRIVWRENPSDPIQDFRLKTITYGTAAGSFLATRALQKLAVDEAENLPLAAAVALRDFYVDDLMSGADNLELALKTQSELNSLATRGGMSLRKWTSNHPAVIQAIPIQLREASSLLPMDNDHVVKTLGIFWKPESDQFNFKIAISNFKAKNKSLTKRIILSEIAKIFDPIGWLSPVIVNAKIFMQKLWTLKNDWDDILPVQIQEEWNQFKIDLPILEKIQIPRYIQCVQEGCQTALIGFCDSSEKAFAAVVYLCVYSTYQHSPAISLISSKTRVAPLKTISLPRLELCSAVLLAHLMHNTKKALNMNIDHISAWSDSTVTLAWIKSHPSRWNRFVANRVTEIQERVPENCWGHVKGEENPADCASRGLVPTAFIGHSLWWSGPQWLTNGVPHPTPLFVVDNTITGEEKPRICATAIALEESCLIRYSTLSRVQRITAWILRFISNCKYKIQSKSIYPHPHQFTGFLSLEELDSALHVWIKIVQKQYFKSEIHSLQTGRQIKRQSRILSLTPFIDNQTLLRVGGRLRRAPVPLDQRHPILLPRHSRLTELIIRNEHEKTLHGGPQLILSSLQTRFWILRGRDAIRQQLRKCIQCMRHKATTMSQIMSDLPSFRVTPSRAFANCGVDYAGSFNLSSISRRSKASFKGYLCIFICTTTRAVHLELVSSLSTDAFIAAFRRFISRRGKPTNIYSDCGSNFVGAEKEINELASFLQQKHEVVHTQMSNDGIKWHFNPPGAPHFGGIWEAGVKSVKIHLRHMVGHHRLNFEEFSTLLTQIEAILNSRPLTPGSSDPNDFTALTPGHFLIGCPLTELPNADVTGIKLGRLSRWQLLQNLQQHFWKRWSLEFISRLQQRPKWMYIQRQIRIGDLVLLKEDNLAPMKWKLGRVQETHPGEDGFVRVVTIKTSTGTYKRPIVKLCLLPIDSPQESI